MRSSKTLPNKRTRYTKLQVATGMAFHEKLNKKKLLHVEEWEPIFYALSKLSDRDAGQWTPRRYKTVATINNLHYSTHFLSTLDISNLYSRHNVLNFELQRPEFGVTQEKLLCSNTIMAIQQHEYNHHFLSENRSFISSTENDLKTLMLLTCICFILCAKNAPAMIAVNIETLHSTFGSFETKSRVNVCFYLLVPSSSLLKALVAGMEPFWKKKINGVLHCFL